MKSIEFTECGGPDQTLNTENLWGSVSHCRIVRLPTTWPRQRKAASSIKSSGNVRSLGSIFSNDSSADQGRFFELVYIFFALTKLLDALRVDEDQA